MCDRCAELEEQVRQLQDLLVNNDEAPQYGMTALEWDIYCLIRQRGAARRMFLEDAIMAITGNDIMPQTLTVHIHKINRKLQEHGQPRIKNKWGWGYMMDAEHGHSDRSAAA